MQDELSEAEVTRLREQMVNYTDNQPTRTEQDLVDLRGRAAAVNLWPEGSLQNASYWVLTTIPVLDCTARRCPTRC